MMSVQHLSDEAVAAFADGVLSGRARDRAIRHIERCPECNAAVAVQREAMWALRAAPAPGLPGGLLDRLRVVPQCTPITPLPTVLGSDGSTMLSVLTPAAALVPDGPAQQSSVRVRPLVGAAALLAAIGALAAGSASATVSGHPAPVQPTHELSSVLRSHAPAAVFVDITRGR